MINFLLFILAFLLVATLTPIGIVYTIVKSALTCNLKYIKHYFKYLAISLDQFGNVAMSGLFNTILIMQVSSNKFGNPDETISSVLGKNKIRNTLTRAGKLLDLFLNKLDNNHSINSIEKL